MKKVKSVSFNTEVPEEKAILKYIGKKNFSKFAKEAILMRIKAEQDEREQKRAARSQPQQPETPKDRGGIFLKL